MNNVIIACIIMHNMIVENERDEYALDNNYLFEDQPVNDDNDANE